MRKNLLLAGLTAAALIPSLAMAQETCEQRSANRAVGTVVGAGLGALVGSAVAGHGDRGTGAVIGAVGGGVIGNQASKGPRDCQHAYGYYDNDNRWHSNTVDRTSAYGYYDRNGVWIDGAPNGAWDSNGRYVASSAAVYGTNASYESHSNTLDVYTRIDRMGARIEQSRDNRSLSGREYRNARNALSDIRSEANSRRHHGRLSDRDEAILQAKLDRLQTQVHIDRLD